MWPAGAAQAADWPRWAGVWGSLPPPLAPVKPAWRRSNRALVGLVFDVHWYMQVLPLLGDPAVVSAGDEISVQLTMELDADIGVPPSYQITATILTNGNA